MCQVFIGIAAAFCTSKIQKRPHNMAQSRLSRNRETASLQVCCLARRVYEGSANPYTYNQAKCSRNYLGSICLQNRSSCWGAAQGLKQGRVSSVLWLLIKLEVDNRLSELQKVEKSVKCIVHKKRLMSHDTMQGFLSLQLEISL